MCTLFVNLYMLLTWGPHMVYHGVLIYILHLYDPIWLVHMTKTIIKLNNECYGFNCNKLFDSVTSIELIK